MTKNENSRKSLHGGKVEPTEWSSDGNFGHLQLAKKKRILLVANKRDYLAVGSWKATYIQPLPSYERHKILTEYFALLSCEYFLLDKRKFFLVLNKIKHFHRRRSDDIERRLTPLFIRTGESTKINETYQSPCVPVHLWRCTTERQRHWRHNRVSAINLDVTGYYVRVSSS